MPEGSRHFPPPWRADRIPGGYVVRDANGQAIAYIYSRENEAEARQAKVLTKDEARRVAINIARLPELLGMGERDRTGKSGRSDDTSIDRDLGDDGRRRRLCPGPSATAAPGIARDQPGAARGDVPRRLCLRDSGLGQAHLPRVCA
jgi:hypothetical protein